MACSTCSRTDHETNCPQEISFELDGTVLYGRCGAVPIRPIDLAPVGQSAETDTDLSLDRSSRRLVYTGEKDTDTIAVADIASLMSLNDIGDVQYQISTDGDILAYNSTTGTWTSYTIPSGTLVSTVGIDADGRLVKASGSGPTPDPSSMPLGVGFPFFGEINAIPIN